MPRSLLRLLGLLIAACLSWWLMSRTFWFGPHSGTWYVSDRVWSDFGSHLPLIRSFSWGSNWPPEYPLFPGQPIRYHFLFYLLVAGLEKLGLALPLSLNLLSSAGFFALLCFIYLFASRLFSRSSIGIISVVLFLFNSSGSFIYFLRRLTPGSSWFSALIHSDHFAAFAPWDGGLITAFWNLNIYTNQRHFALSLALALALLYLVLFTARRSRFPLLGLGLLVLLFLHPAIFICLILGLGTLFISSPRQHLWLFKLSLVLIPGFWLYSRLSPPAYLPVWSPGYLAPLPLTPFTLINYWTLNLGLSLFLIPLAGLLFFRRCPPLILWLCLLFLLPNLFRFSPDMINNHKFFNLFLVIGQMFTSAFLVRIWDWGKLWRIIAALLLLLLTSGGITDIFPLVNHHLLVIADAPADPDIAYIRAHAPPQSIFLNSFWFYHPASLAGRKIYNGYPYFTWSYGYDQTSREKDTAFIYSIPTLSQLCSALSSRHINYVELSPRHESFLSPSSLWLNLPPDYISSSSGLKLYSFSRLCPAQ